jgi:hypothetical protein
MLLTWTIWKIFYIVTKYKSGGMDLDVSKVDFDDFKLLNDEEERCLCNKLICIVKGPNIEIKCNKCKRLMIIKTNGVVGVEVR